MYLRERERERERKREKERERKRERDRERERERERYRELEFNGSINKHTVQPKVNAETETESVSDLKQLKESKLNKKHRRTTIPNSNVKKMFVLDI